jgi:predicted phosphodiesterase
LKVYIISDSHGFHHILKPPSDIDMVIHCGDASNSFDSNKNIAEMQDFLSWYERLNINHKIYVPGNHDTSIERNLINLQDYPTIKFLIHQETEIEGIRIFGSPYTPTYGNWAYMRNRNKLGELWKKAPDDVDIWINHGPAKGILDLATDHYNSNKIVQTGCASLYKKIMSSKISLICFGHIHQERKLNNYGVINHFGKTFVNAACLNHSEQIFYNGWTLDYNDGKISNISLA